MVVAKRAADDAILVRVICICCNDIDALCLGVDGIREVANILIPGEPVGDQDGGHTSARQ